MYNSPAARMTAYFPSYARKMLGNTCQYCLRFLAHLPKNLLVPTSAENHTSFTQGSVPVEGAFNPPL
jgi:hypothetical protein